MATVRLSVEDFESGNVPHVCAWTGEHPDQWRLLRTRDVVGWLPASRRARSLRRSWINGLSGPVKVLAYLLFTANIALILRWEEEPPAAVSGARLATFLCLIALSFMADRYTLLRASRVGDNVALEGVDPAFADACSARGAPGR